MRYKEEIKIYVRKLRALGQTLDQIQVQTGLPRTTIHDWISDISLTSEQYSMIRENALKSLQKGRQIAQQTIRSKRLRLEKMMLEQGIKEINELNKREFFVTGVALYWAEGFKNNSEHRLGFCNSDPDMIRFYLRWLDLIGVDKSKVVARLTVNLSYKEEAYRIMDYWASATGIPISQFTKPFFQQTKWKKQYENNNYYGVLRVHVNGSIEKLLLMKGWIIGLKQNIFINRTKF